MSSSTLKTRLTSLKLINWVLMLICILSRLLIYVFTCAPFFRIWGSTTYSWVIRRSPDQLVRSWGHMVRDLRSLSIARHARLRSLLTVRCVWRMCCLHTSRIWISHMLPVILVLTMHSISLCRHHTWSLIMTATIVVSRSHLMLLATLHHVPIMLVYCWQIFFILCLLLCIAFMCSLNSFLFIFNLISC